MLAVGHVNKIKLKNLVLIVVNSNVILKINWKRLYFVMKEKKMDRRRKAAGSVPRKSVSSQLTLLKVVIND